jgi:5-methylcytosine-specific restriction endonuclease McrA
MPNLPRNKKQSHGKRTPTGDRRFYKSRRWAAIRRDQLQSYPLCEVHRAAGFLVPADVVDHVIRMTDGGSQSDGRNLMSLCSTCHDRKSALERRGLQIETATNDLDIYPTFAGRQTILEKLIQLL